MKPCIGTEEASAFYARGVYENSKVYRSAYDVNKPGYGTTAYLFGFGRVLAEPFFSALDSLPDGLYSTFWGDGLCGGVGAWCHRPPWRCASRPD